MSKHKLMSRGEAHSWIYYLISTGGLSLAYVAIGITTGDWLKPFILWPIFAVVAEVAFLFRLTYLKGRQKGRRQGARYWTR